MNNNIEQSNILTANMFKKIPKLMQVLFYNSNYPWEILTRINKYITEIIPHLPGERYKEYSDGVWIGTNTRVSKKSEIVGPVIIGRDCEIRPGAYIRGNVIIGNNCVIGNSTEIKNSVLLDCVQVPHYNYVGDSILGYHSHLGAGAVCSNLKQDKSIITIKLVENISTGLSKLGAIISENVEVGCGCVLNPGTIILEGSRIYPLNSVRGIIPQHCIMKTEQILETIKLP